MMVHARAWLADYDTSWLRGDVVGCVAPFHVASTLAEAHQTVDDIVNKWRGAPSTVA